MSLDMASRYGQRFLSNQDDRKSQVEIRLRMSVWAFSVDSNVIWSEKCTPDLIIAWEAEVDQEVLDYLNLDPQDDGPPGRPCFSVVANPGGPNDSVQRNILAPTQMSPVLSSYIDDIAHGAPTWGALCADFDALLYRLRYWNISVSLPKCEFGKLSIPYLSHEISAEGIRATPKIAKGVQDLPFPTTLKGVKFFLGSLNYYHKFIEDDPVVEASLYELSDDQVRSGRDLSRAKQAFEILKHKIVSTPDTLTGPNLLGQEHDGLIQPVRFTGRVLHDAELRYHIAEKEVIAVLRVLQVFRTLIQGCPLVVYTRHSVLKWIMKSKTADGRCVPWGVLLSQWNLDVSKIQRDEDGLAAILGAGITPREHLDEVAEELIPAKGRAKPPPIISVEMLEDTFEGIVLSFDGAAKTSTRQDVTVNDAEYCGLLNGLTMAQARGVRDLIAVGDSRIVLQQVQGLINCNQPNLQRRLTSCETLKAKFDSRDFNQAADYLTSKTLLLGRSWSVQDDGERQHLERVSNIQEKWMKSAEGHPATGHSGFVITQDEEGCPDDPRRPSTLD
ncbi:reverse transcriptase, partial [Phytophthora megakarya]